MRYVWLIALLLLFGGCLDHKSVVRIYVSEDRVFSEPILKAFERQSGIKVEAIYDTEESKGTGLMNRIIAEAAHPQADLYWANEPIRAEVLRQKGLLQPYHSPNAKDIPDLFKDPDGYWCGFSARLRLFLVHDGTKLEPTSVLDYAKESFAHKGVIANPLFGTTAVHIAALFVVLKERAKEFLYRLKQNAAISTSNGESADLVAQGKYQFALVDSDDAVARIRRGAKVHIRYPDQKPDQMGIFVVPNAVMILKKAPHPKLAKKLMDYLLSPATEEALAKMACAQIPLHPHLAPPKELKPLEELKILPVRYEEVAKKLVQIQPILREWAKE